MKPKFRLYINENLPRVNYNVIEEEVPLDLSVKRFTSHNPIKSSSAVYISSRDHPLDLASTDSTHRHHLHHSHHSLHHHHHHTTHHLVIANGHHHSSSNNSNGNQLSSNNHNHNGHGNNNNSPEDLHCPHKNNNHINGNLNHIYQNTIELKNHLNSQLTHPHLNLNLDRHLNPSHHHHHHHSLNHHNHLNLNHHQHSIHLIQSSIHHQSSLKSPIQSPLRSPLRSPIQFPALLDSSPSSSPQSTVEPRSTPWNENANQNNNLNNNNHKKSNSVEPLIKNGDLEKGVKCVDENENIKSSINGDNDSTEADDNQSSLHSSIADNNNARRTSRPLMGKHVRRGTGASPQILSRLKSLLQDKKRLKDSGLVPATWKRKKMAKSYS